MTSPDAVPVPAADALVAELVTLVRGLKELGAATSGSHRRIDLPAAMVLAQLDECGALRLSTLADRLHLDLSTVSRQVPALEDAGWLVREPDPNDRRAALLRVTDAGRAALAERRRAHADLLRAALPDWTEAELHSLARDLARFNTDLAAQRGSRPTPFPQAPLAQPAPVHQEAS